MAAAGGIAQATDKFTIEYSYNCDGGIQEFSSAKSAILAILPDAQIKGERNHNYPIKVTIRDGTGKAVWANDQRALFRKYPMQRAKSVEEIKDIVRNLKSGRGRTRLLYTDRR